MGHWTIKLGRQNGEDCSIGQNGVAYKYEIQSFSCVQLFVSQNVSLLHVATIQNWNWFIQNFKKKWSWRFSCFPISVTNTSLLCVTSAARLRARRATNSTRGDVQLVFDGYRAPTPNVQFTFTPDPQVDLIEPKQSILRWAVLCARGLCQRVLFPAYYHSTEYSNIDFKVWFHNCWCLSAFQWWSEANRDWQELWQYSKPQDIFYESGDPKFQQSHWGESLRT